MVAKKQKTQPQPLHDELNFARFRVISMHLRVDQSVTAWNHEFTMNGRTFRMKPSRRRDGHTALTRTP